MKVLYGGKLWEWEYGSQRLYDSSLLINPKEKIFLNGNGSGVCMMAPIKEVKTVIQIKKERRKNEWNVCLD